MFEPVKRKIYLDTSIVSALFDERTPERQSETKRFWRLLQSGKYDVCISKVTISEIERCSDQLQEKMFKALNVLELDELNETVVALNLVKQYLSFGVLTEKSRDDCRHIAIASLAGCHYITSWNFKHFLNVRTIERVQALNKMLGLGEINILPPSMLLEGDETYE
jgi:predicted nucleic acid-binding protein